MHETKLPNILKIKINREVPIEIYKITMALLEKEWTGKRLTTCQVDNDILKNRHG